MVVWERQTPLETCVGMICNGRLLKKAQQFEITLLQKIKYVIICRP
jgi:hypothetical protein